MATPLNTGYNVIINQKVGGVNTPLYPFTRFANVKDADGNTLDEIVAGLAAKEHGNHVPAFDQETVSSLRFLRNDNTWADIQAASTSQAGVVQLSDSVELDDSTIAATSKAVKAVNDAVKALSEGSSQSYINVDKLGVADGVATLDSNGLVPSSQLPSYVDDVVEVEMAADLASAKLADGSAVTPEAGKIYVNVLGTDANAKTYRWSGSQFVVISETLALGETSATAFDGERGKAAYDHSIAAHARVDATKTEASANNGYIKVDGADVLVYTHPQETGFAATNPHGTTAADVGLGNVENKSGATIRSEMTNQEVVTALGYTPANETVLATASNNGLMSAAYAGKLDNCMQTAVDASTPAFADGIWFEIVQ